MNQNNLLETIISLYNCPTNKHRANKYLNKTINNAGKIKLAISKKTPQDILAILADDEHYYVRCRIALNPSTPTETIEMLSKDKIIVVREYAANNPATPKHSLEKLANDNDGVVRAKAKERLRLIK